MTRQSSIIDASAKALSHFDRLTGVARESVRVMRAAESMALPGKYRWEFPEKDSLLKNKQSFEAGLLFKRRIVGDGSGRGSIGDPGWSETDDRNRPRGVKWAAARGDGHCGGACRSSDSGFVTRDECSVAG
jgi:hypothetical protein